MNDQEDNRNFKSIGIISSDHPGISEGKLTLNIRNSSLLFKSLDED